MKERFKILGAMLKHALSFAGDIIILNLLFLVCSIPLFTIGASATAAYAGLCRTFQKKETGMVFRAFFSDFRAAFKQATGAWLLQLVVFVILAGDLWFALVYSEPRNTFFLVFAIVIGAIMLLASLWLYPLLARFRNRFGAQIKNAFLLAFAQFPRTLLALLVWALVLGIPVLIYDLYVYFGWFWLLCGFSLPMYVTVKVFSKQLHLEATPEESEQD